MEKIVNRRTIPKTVLGYGVNIQKNRDNNEYYLTLPAFPNIKPNHSKSKGRTIRDAWVAVQEELDSMEKKGQKPPETYFNDPYFDNLAKKLQAINRELSKFGFCAIAEDLNEAEMRKLEKICDEIQKLSQDQIKDKSINEQIENQIVGVIIGPLRSADQRALNMVGMYMKVDHLKEFSHLVEQAYFNFFSADAISTTMVLVPVIEGLLLSWYGFDLSKGHSLPEDNQLLNFVAEQECMDNQMIHPLMVEEYIRTFVYTYKNIFHASHEEAEKKSFFNRHYIAHMMGPGKFFKRNNAYKIMLLTDLLAHIIAACKGQHDRWHTETSEFKPRSEYYRRRFEIALDFTGNSQFTFLMEHKNFCAD